MAANRPGNPLAVRNLRSDVALVAVSPGVSSEVAEWVTYAASQRPDLVAGPDGTVKMRGKPPERY